jgi:hypothetical protein
VLATGLSLTLLLGRDTMTADGAPAAATAATLATEAALRVSLGGSAWQVGPNQGFSYRVTVTNGGNAAAPALVETRLHPALGNVTVAAPGFTCTRQFEASGSQPGTTVTCTSWEPLGPGMTASVDVRARSATSPGTYPVVAWAAEDGASDEESRTSTELRVD